MIRDVNSVVQFSSGTLLPKYNTDTAGCDGPLGLSTGFSSILHLVLLFVYVLRV